MYLSHFAGTNILLFMLYSPFCWEQVECKRLHERNIKVCKDKKVVRTISSPESGALGAADGHQTFHTEAGFYFDLELKRKKSVFIETFNSNTH